MKKSSFIRLSVGTAAFAILVSSLIGTATSSSATASRGGTLYILTQGDSIAHLDPQRNYTGEDLAFTGAFLTRTLTQFRYSTNAASANTIIPDAATTTGVSSNGSRTWAFKLRKGIKWQDGSLVTCADFKYGVARRFSKGITGGPSYSVQYLNIPSGPYGFGSAYPGLYDRPATSAHPEFGDITEPTAAQTALFNNAVKCTGTPTSTLGETITFYLKQPVPDFNGATTLQEFSAVKQSYDTNTYNDDIQSNGPYKIDTYDADMLKLVRNENWAEATDSTRPAYPDVIQMEFNIEPEVVTARLKANSGNDQNAISADGIYPTQLSAVMTGSQYASRRIAGFDPYVGYRAINTTHITQLAKRLAIMAAWPREQVRTLGGGAYAGSYGDGVIKPSMGMDYAPTNIWGYNTTKLVKAAKPAVLARKVGSYYYCAAAVIVANRVAQGTVCTPAVPAEYSVTPHPGAIGYVIPDTGSPAVAAKIMSDAGITNPGELTYDYYDSGSAVAAQVSATIKSALESAGFEVTLNGIQDSGAYYDTILDPDSQGDLSGAGWGPDWSNASTVIPPLFTEAGGFDLSHYTEEGFQGRIAAALVTTNRSAQANKWKALSKEVVAQGLVVPGLFSATQRLQGSNVKNAYIWAPYGSYPYAQLAVQ